METNETQSLKELLHFSPKQTEALKAAFKHRYTLYGGAMAGGKSYWLRWMLVALLVRWASKGYKSVEVGLFCEDYPTLKDRQLSKIGSEFPSWLGTLHGDHAQHGRCYILAEEYGGGIIKFRNLDDPSKYQSAEFAAIAVDELTKNTEDVFTDLRNRLRWPGISDIRFLSATNPGGIGHSWVKKRWLDRVFDENETEPEEFKYVRALAQDNPHIDKSYLKQLESLPADKRKAYLEGDWDIFKGQYFTEWRREIHTCAPFTIPEDWRKFCAIDYGYNHDAAVGWFASDYDGNLFLYRELVQNGLTGTKLAEEWVSMTPTYEKIEYLECDPSMWAKRGEDDSALSVAEKFEARATELLKNAKYKCPTLRRANNDRITGWRELHEWLKPISVEGHDTARFKVFTTCPEVIRTIPAMIHDEHNPEDVEKSDGDDAPDMVRYGVMSRPRPNVTREQVAAHEFAQAMKRKHGLLPNHPKRRFVK